MPTDVKLPRLGQGMESGVIVRWLKSEGDAVKKGEPLYELDTDKVTQEVEAEVDGTLVRIVVPEGEVEVGATVATIESNGAAEPADAVPAGSEVAESSRPVKPPPEAEAKPPAQERSSAPAPTSGGARVKASPLARRIARERGVDLHSVQGTGPETYAGLLLGQDDENNVQNFVVMGLDLNLPPAGFSLVSPLDNSIIYSLTPVVQWTEAVDPNPGDPVAYTVAFDEDAAFAWTFHGFLDARVVLEAAHGADRPVKGLAAAVSLEDRFADLDAVAVLVTQIGRVPGRGCRRRRHGMRRGTRRRGAGGDYRLPASTDATRA